MQNQQAAATGGAYTYSQQPQGLPPKRATYRPDDQDISVQPSNIMWDRRVFRGNTYASQVMPPSAAAEAERLAAEREARRRQRAAARRAAAAAAARPVTPPPVDGRAHIDVQTEVYLEVLEDEAPKEHAETQTEAAPDRPASPIFVPPPAGVEAGTQVAPGELWDFDAEVEPILEVLVGKTLEQSLLQVLEEEELAAIRRQRAEFQQQRDAELAVVQRMEAAARRKEEEKVRRREQERARLQREAAARRKVAALAVARQYVNTLQQDTFARMVNAGAFKDPVAEEVETEFLPGVYAAAAESVQHTSVAERLIADLLATALARGADSVSAAAAARAAAEEETARAAEAARLRKSERRAMRVAEKESEAAREVWAEQDAAAAEAGSDEEED